MQFHAKDHWSQPQSANAGTYRATLLGRAIDTNHHNQQLLGLIEGLSTGVSQATRTLPNSISNSWDLSRSSPRSLQRPSPLLQASPLQLRTDTTSHLFPAILSAWIFKMELFFKYLAHVNMFYFGILFLIYFSFSLIYHQF